MFHFFCIVLFILPEMRAFPFGNSENVVHEGNVCRTKTGANGICTLIYECNWLWTNLKNNTMTDSDIVACGYDGYRYIICCGVLAIETPKTTIPTTPIAPSNSIGKSVIACQQYPQIESRDRIVGGVPAMLGDYPHMAVLGRLSQEVGKTYDWFCGGSLISERYVLTAAHCGKPTVVRLHDIDLANESSDDITIDVEMMTRHPNYKKSLVYNDIALVKLANSINFTEIIFPACLWTESDENLLLSKSTISACGFGVKQFASSENSKQLIKIGLKVVNIGACNASYIASEALRKLPNYIAPSQLCAFDETLKNDTCQGDSGGPLQILHDNKYKLIGVISFGFSCASAIPSVYTRVSHYTEWIESIVWP